MKKEEKGLKVFEKIVKENKKLTKREIKDAGITLIALVITIIVLLILAGVTIATLTGDNGILTNANKAAIETDLARNRGGSEFSLCV